MVLEVRELVAVVLRVLLLVLWLLLLLLPCPAVGAA
jgi:hypothetical protein